MNKNIFMISDASYCPKTLKAGIGVLDTSNSKKYEFIANNVKSSFEAEFIALVYSVKIALKERHAHVVFVYDCMGLDLTNLEIYITNKFITAQFLWLKREFTSEADKLARKALTLSKSLNALTSRNKISEKQFIAKAIRTFSSYDYKQIIKACMYDANKFEYEILEIFLKGKFDIYNLPEYKFHSKLLRFVYHMLPNDKKEKFYGLIISINPLILTTKGFKSRPSNVILSNRIDSIFNKIKTKKKIA